MTDHTAMLSELLVSYRSAWQENSAQRIESHWDTAHPPLYKPEEITHVISDWDELRAYWHHNERFNSINRLSWSDQKVQPLGEGVLLVTMRMRWDIRFGADVRQMDGQAFAWAGKAMGGDNHVMACLRRVDDDWRFVAWVEAPDAPLLYMAQLYQKNVRADFPED